jgi:serine/threonine protein kinase
MELVEEDLGSLIERNTRLYNGAPFPLMIAIDILLQIVEAMVHVHKCGELHRNLGPSNVLVHPKSASTSSREDINVYYLVKLTGFLRDGVVNKMPGSTDVLYDSFVRARGYMAPAMRHFPKEEYTQATDVWSFGWIAHDVVLGPYILGSERNRPLLPDWCSQGLKDLMTKCWGTNPQVRPSFEQIRKELMTIKYKEEVSSSS